MGLFRKAGEKPKSGGVADQIRCDEKDFLIWKWHPEGTVPGKNERENAIRWGSSLRVKDGEVAVFVYKQKNGPMQDYILGPFDEYIKTKNLPVLSSIIGAAYDGKTPFQAEIYFINLAEIIQSRFAVPFFDVFDPRLPDFGVPVAVRGVISFKITDYFSFIKLHRLDSFSMDTFQKQVRDAVARYTKDVVANAPSRNNIPVVQIESKIAQITDLVEFDITKRFQETFGVTVTGVDIAAIEIDKSSQGYKELVAVTRDITTATVQAQGAAAVKNIHDKQQIEAENYRETLRIQREEAQYAQHLQAQSQNTEVFQIGMQAEVGKAGAAALGQMGSNSAGSIDLGNGGSGFNPAAMMAGMTLGSVVGQNIAGTLNGIMSPNAPQGTTPPPIPQVMYNVVIDGKIAGPFDAVALQQMAQSGQINRQTLIWKPGMPAWAPLEEMSDLISVISSIPPVI
ncbi:MAG: SPFH domain-containing protein [Lachnospiraceae bacterium]|nr:SPFH domain-containing protein [Lachnospiraceae bacterium]